ncbi:MAG: F0F1 ATP synthase subunit delta [Dehalococcoidia bacterium]|nr:F0F1 ATP synthase subunit delta [Dehalococcoidia bacterium]
MPRGGSPTRHALAVFTIAREQDRFDKWLQDLGQLSQISQDPLFRAVMDNPKLSVEEKLGLLPDKLSGLSPMAVNLLALLVARYRLRLIPDIYKEYRKLVNAHQGVTSAELVTAVPMEDTVKDAVTSGLEAITGGKVVVTTRVDPSLLGGLVAYIGDTLLDGSVRSKLKALRKSLVTSGR